MLNNWKPLLYAMLMAFMRWLQDELDNSDKRDLRQRERIIFPGDEEKNRDLEKMADMENPTDIKQPKSGK